jgi:rsbT antagonist protein RsbS
MADHHRVPVVSVGGCLVVSIQVAPSDSVLAQLRVDLCETISNQLPRGLVLDVHGVDLLDSFMTRNLHDIVGTARLMGVPSAICGLRPDVALTLVEMGLTLRGIHTALSLDRALAHFGSVVKRSSSK